MNILEQNLNIIKTKYPDLVKLLEHYPEDTTCRLIPAVSGKEIIQKSDTLNNWFNLGSTIDPEGQAKEHIKKLKSKIDECPDFFFLGMGSGYEIIEFAKEQLDSWLIIFEPDVSVFRKNLEIHDFSFIFNRPKVKIILGTQKQIFSEGLFQFFAKTFLKKITLEVNNYASKIYQVIYAEYKNEIQSCINRFMVNLNTSIVFGKRFAYHLIRNVTELIKNSNIEHFKNKFENTPAIIVSAGPSLDDSIKDLKEIKDKALIIAVDSALKPLMDNGIEPHFVVTIDIQSRKSIIFKEIEKQYPNADYIVAPVQYCHPKIVKSTNKRKTFIWVESPVTSWLEKSFGPHDKFGECLSCAHAAFYLAKYLGSNPIILIGQDLCHSNGGNQRHASGTIGTHSLAKGSHRYDFKKDKGACYVVGNDGKPYPSVKTLAAFIKTFEVAIANTPAKVFNATKLGAKIEGAEWKQIDELSRIYLTQDYNFKDLLNQLYQISDSKYKDTFLNELEKFKGYLSEILNLAPDLKRSTEKALKILCKKNIRQKDGQKLKNVDAKKFKFEQLLFKSIYSHMIQQPMLQINLIVRDMDEKIFKEKNQKEKSKLSCKRLIYLVDSTEKILKFYLKVIEKVKRKL